MLGELLEERLIKTEEVLDEASGKRDLYVNVLACLETSIHLSYTHHHP